MEPAVAAQAEENKTLTEDELLRKMRKEEKAKEKEAKKKKASEKAMARKPSNAKEEKNSNKTEKKLSSTTSELDKDHTPTEIGQKKILLPEMAKSFSPTSVEAYWYEWWEKRDFFTGDNSSTKPNFSIVIPPPNVTGALHIGHALTSSIQDTIARWRRMSGYNVCWLPGCDHAGIATQVVVEKKLMKERGINRHDIGRENFIQEVWKWKETYGSRIMLQERKLAASLDWSRECFTMDDNLSRAVTEAFIQLYEKKLIYRDNRLVNWDCVLKTAISDIEVDYVEIKGKTKMKVPNYTETVEFGVITSFAYPMQKNDGENDELIEIVVSTTRPETMLGDTAIAVHPDDERYKKYHNKYAIHPFNNRKLPIICDAELVDMSFGTGAVKITPAHDPNDFATGKRHSLEFINIFTDEGLINSNGGKEFEGLKRFDARKYVVKRLEELGLYRGVADNPMRLGICSRSGDVIEPIIKPQWYVQCDTMAKKSCDAVRNGSLKILPKTHEDTWFRWLENIRDWCISRQLWWGHRIPAYYALLDDDKTSEIGLKSENWIIARTQSEAEEKAKAKYGPDRQVRLFQDPDVLDTWFSSGLFPFSVFGWPENTKDLNAFYPTSLLETGHDILFFWVARMVMLGLELTGNPPFEYVYLHAMVRDAHGRKMSKSLGNVIDPLEVIYGAALEELQSKLELGNLDKKEVEIAKLGQKKDFPTGIPECGCDALRFALVSYTLQELNINLDIQRVVGYRLWCNKLWNAIRFALINLGPSFSPNPEFIFSSTSSLPPSCQWILSTLNSTISKTVSSFENYDFASVTTAVYSFWQYQLCDVFIEIIKPVLFKGEEESSVQSNGGANGGAAMDEKEMVRNTLWICLDNGLRLLHPIMPFVTEELWQRLPGRENVYTEESIMISPYPSYVKEWNKEALELQMKEVENLVRSIRSLRMAYNLQKNQRPALYLDCKTELAAAVIQNWKNEISTLALLEKIEVICINEKAPLGCAISVVGESFVAHLFLLNVVNVDMEMEKLNQRYQETLKSHGAIVSKMEAQNYETRVPKNVQEENTKKMNKLKGELDSVQEAIQNFEKLRLLN